MLRKGRSLRRNISVLIVCLGIIVVPAVHAEDEEREAEPWQVKGVLAALEEPNRHVQLHALQRLRHLKTVGAVSRIAKFLDTNDPEIVAASVRALGQIGPSAQSYNERLLELLKASPSPEVQVATVEALGKLLAKEAVPALIERMKDADLLEVAASALVLLGAKEAVPQFLELLEHSQWKVRLVAVQSLGQLGAKEATSRLINRLKDQDSEVREAAANALRELGAKEVAPLLLKRLNNPNWEVRKTVAVALGQLKASEAMRPLVDALNDPDSRVKQAAAEALGLLMAQEAVRPLVDALKDPDSRVKQAAAEALGLLKAQEAVRPLVETLNDPNSRVKQAAAEALGLLKAQEAVRPLVDALNDPDSRVKQVAAEALGQLGAKEVAPLLVERLNDPELKVRAAVATALVQLKSQEAVRPLVEKLKDPNSRVRQMAAWILGQLKAGEAVQPLVKRLTDTDASVRTQAAMALERFAPFDSMTVLSIVGRCHENTILRPWIRFLGHYLGGGESEPELLLRWLCIADRTPVEHLTREEGVKALRLFERLWEATAEVPRLRDELQDRIAGIATTVSWKHDELPLLKQHRANLAKERASQVDTLDRIIKVHDRWRLAIRGVKILGLHVLVWVALLLAYPRFPQVQAIFFWHPWARRFVGLGYVGFLLTWTPYLRRTLFAPFKNSLLADANLEKFEREDYFADLRVKNKVTGAVAPIYQVVPEIRGQLVLEGESGIGKSMFLKSRVQASSRVVAFLPAHKCDNGVLEAIQVKLHGPAKDPEFLRNLVYSGAIDIIIDGLNEVSADTRAKITEFVESYFKGNFILATQPLEWIPPSTAKVFVVQPLERDQIQRFLLTRERVLTEELRESKVDYGSACQAYLQQLLDIHDASHEAKEIVLRVLSNPMDLTGVARLIARGKKPNLYRLQEQQFEIMVADYETTHLRTFPLDQFAEAVYQTRLHDKAALPAADFLEELQCMERHKMLVTRQSGKPIKEWLFRHDKIMEFFIVRTFMGEHNERPIRHLGDPKFRGVYLLLALLLPLQAAQVLRDQIIMYAAKTKDHTVSDDFVQLLYSRKVA